MSESTLSPTINAAKEARSTAPVLVETASAAISGTISAVRPWNQRIASSWATLQVAASASPAKVPRSAHSATSASA